MSDRSATVTPLRPRRPCPECGRPSARETFPFCSPRCKDVDLNRWLSGSYVIRGRDDEDDGAGPAADDGSS
jgi:endogenous inhibitor of DNA gyrase (YacG/DUF329 family)